MASSTVRAPEAAAGNAVASVWRNHEFRWFFARQTLSDAGSTLTQVAVPLIGVVTLKVDAGSAGLLAAVRYLPFILLSVPAGVLADRASRRMMLALSDLGRALAVAAVPVLWALHLLSLPVLLLVLFASDGLRVLFDVAYQSYVPELVEQEQLLQANTVLESSSSAARMVGPGLAGSLVAALGAPLTLLVDAVTYVVSALTLLQMRPHPRRADDTEPVGGGRLRESLLVGFRLIGREPALRTMLLAGAVSNGSLMLVQGVVYVFLARDAHLGVATIGLVMVAPAAGAVLGSVSASRVGRRFSPRQTMLAGYAFIVCGSLCFPLSYGGRGTRVAATLVVGYALWEIGFAFFNIHALSYRQKITPPGLMGRVSGASRTVLFGSLVVGAAGGGLLAQVSTIGTTFWLAVAGNVVALALLAVGLRRRGAMAGE